MGQHLTVEWHEAADARLLDDEQRLVAVFLFDELADSLLIVVEPAIGQLRSEVESAPVVPRAARFRQHFIMQVDEALRFPMTGFVADTCAKKVFR